ncbi:MAG: ACT domain-containing protein [Firmicutes bacterium]|jgi:chorismate mutase|nr:ACT domain-containing protein [Bacillota bacterium]
MMHKNEYYIVDREALPEVYSQVVEAKRLLASGKADTVQEAVDMVGISRSSFYKYKDMIEPFTDMVRRKTVTIAAKLEDMPGVLPKFLLVLEEAGVNILTIHQAIPINGLADVSLSMEVLEEAWRIDEIMAALKSANGVHEIQILARE